MRKRQAKKNRARFWEAFDLWEKWEESLGYDISNKPWHFALFGNFVASVPFGFEQFYKRRLPCNIGYMHWSRLS